MPKKAENNLLVGLDIGTSKVVAVVAETLQDGSLEIIGVGAHPSRGLKKGIVVNLDSTIQSIQRAVEEAELMAGCQIHSVYTAITGNHVNSINSNGIVAIKNNVIDKSDVERVLEAAKAVAIPSDQKILHVLPQEYIIDNQERVLDPIGMSGVRLEAKIHIITGSVSAAQNIVTSIRRCSLEVDEMVLAQLAAADSVLTEDEKQLGVCFIDIGAGTSDIIAYLDGSVCYSSVIPVAGDLVTSDIAVALKTASQSAENIKIKYGCALQSLASADHPIEVPSIGHGSSRQISQRALASVIEPRFEELFCLIKSQLQKSRVDKRLNAGLVISGGSVKLPGVIELAGQVFNMPVRVGLPQGAIGANEVIKNPSFATSIGLLSLSSGISEPLFSSGANNFAIGGMFGRIKNWFQGNF